MNAPSTLTRSLRFLLTSLLLSAAVLAAVANTAVTPAPRMSAGADPKPSEPWLKRHEGFVEIAKKGGVDVLFLGDSITDFWGRAQTEKQVGGKKVWDREFGHLRTANFGISADRTQHVLWRLENGELEGIKPKVVVLMIGTNNTGFETDKVTPRNTPAETIAGVTAIVKTLRTKLPQTKVLLLAIFPRGETPDHPQRAQIAEINAALAKLDDGRSIRYLDIGKKFLAEDGTLPKEIMPDFLHPGEKGYEIWAAAIKEPLAQMLK